MYILNPNDPLNIFIPDWIQQGRATLIFRESKGQSVSHRLLYFTVCLHLNLCVLRKRVFYVAPEEDMFV